MGFCSTAGQTWEMSYLGNFCSLRLGLVSSGHGPRKARDATGESPWPPWHQPFYSTGQPWRATALSSSVRDRCLQVGGRRTPLRRAPFRGRRDDLPAGDAGRARDTAPDLPHPWAQAAAAERPGTAFLPSRFPPARARAVSPCPAPRAGAHHDVPGVTPPPRDRPWRLRQRERSPQARRATLQPSACVASRLPAGCLQGRSQALLSLCFAVRDGVGGGPGGRRHLLPCCRHQPGAPGRAAGCLRGPHVPNLPGRRQRWSLRGLVPARLLFFLHIGVVPQKACVPDLPAAFPLHLPQGGSQQLRGAPHRTARRLQQPCSRRETSAPLCGKEAASFLRPPAPRICRQGPQRWPRQGPREGPKQVPAVAPRRPWQGSARPGIRPLEQQETAAEQGPGRGPGRGPSSTARTGRPVLLAEERPPSAGRPGFLQGTAGDREPTPAEVPQPLVPNAVGAAKEEGSRWGPSSKSPAASPSLFQEKQPPSAGRTGFLQGMAGGIPAEVPQPCRAQGLVACPTKKGTTVRPATSIRKYTALHQICSY